MHQTQEYHKGGYRVLVLVPHCLAEKFENCATEISKVKRD